VFGKKKANREIFFINVRGFCEKCAVVQIGHKVKKALPGPLVGHERKQVSNKTILCLYELCACPVQQKMPILKQHYKGFWFCRRFGRWQVFVHYKFLYIARLKSYCIRMEVYQYKYKNTGK